MGLDKVIKVEPSTPSVTSDEEGQKRRDGDGNENRKRRGERGKREEERGKEKRDTNREREREKRGERTDKRMGTGGKERWLVGAQNAC